MIPNQLFTLKDPGKTFEQFRMELRTSLENPQTPLSYPAEWLLDMFNGGRTDSGMRVSEMTALQVSTVLSCVNIIGNAVASLPLNVVERRIVDNRVDKTVAYNHNLFDLLHSEPNKEMTSITWRRTMMCHLLLWGNAYCEIQRNGANQVVGLWPRNPSRTRPIRLTSPSIIQGTLYDTGTLMYETYEVMWDSQITAEEIPGTTDGTRRVVLAEDMIHVVGLSLDGRLGQDVVQLGRQVIGLALATEKYGAKFFANNGQPAGVIELPGDTNKVQMEIFRRSWSESHGGENQHKIGVLPPGAKFNKTQSTPNEGQMLESRVFQRIEIATIFGVPGHMVGADEKSSGKSNVEQSSIEFVLYCLQPHLNAIEHELKRKLFPKVGQTAGKFHVRFDTAGLLYPDAASRSTFYSGGKQNGYLTTNDIRDREGMNPIDGPEGDMLWMPIAMQDAAVAAKQFKQAGDAIDAGNLQAQPPNTVPIGDHPIAKDNAKTAKVAAGARIAMAAAARPKVQPGAPATGKQPPSGPGKGISGGSGKQSAAKTSGNRSEGLDTAIEFTAKAYGPMFQDAVRRACFRKKPNVTDYTTIFGPLLVTVAEVFEVPLGQEVSSQIIGAMFERSKDWTQENAVEVAEAECAAVAKALWPENESD